jgi:hypothetical protein
MELGVEAIHMELKYCERCGGLWLRPQSSGLVFCGACAKVIAGLLPSLRTSMSIVGDGFKPASTLVTCHPAGKA